MGNQIEKKIDKKQQFLDNMTRFGLGKVLEEMADYQNQVVEGVRETGKVGELTLKLKFKKYDKHGVIVEPVVTHKIPKLPIKPVEMWADDSNYLHDHNPDQLTHENVVTPDFKKPVVGAG